MLDNYGLPTTTPAELMEHVERFYAELGRCDQTDLAKQNLFFDNITAGLSDQQKNNLQVDLSEHEIETAISQMANGKTPGPDGLPSSGAIVNTFFAKTFMQMCVYVFIL